VPELPEPVRPFAFLLGTWRGEGVGGYPTLAEDFRYGEEITFACYGKPVIEFHSQSWKLGEQEGQPLARQAGFWRPVANPETPDVPRIEVVQAVAAGLVQIFYGALVNGPSGVHVEMTSDLIGHTETAKQVNTDKRMYAVRGGKLMYAMEMAAVGQPLQAHLSAALDPVA
jgi:hypothetical protein